MTNEKNTQLSYSKDVLLIFLCNLIAWGGFTLIEYVSEIVKDKPELYRAVFRLMNWYDVLISIGMVMLYWIVRLKKNEEIDRILIIIIWMTIAYMISIMICNAIDSHVWIVEQPIEHCAECNTNGDEYYNFAFLFRQITFVVLVVIHIIENIKDKLQSNMMLQQFVNIVKTQLIGNAISYFLIILISNAFGNGLSEMIYTIVTSIVIAFIYIVFERKYKLTNQKLTGKEQCKKWLAFVVQWTMFGLVLAVYINVYNEVSFFNYLIWGDSELPFLFNTYMLKQINFSYGAMGIILVVSLINAIIGKIRKNIIKSS